MKVSLSRTTYKRRIIENNMSGKIIVFGSVIADGLICLLALVVLNSNGTTKTL